MTEWERWRQELDDVRMEFNAQYGDTRIEIFDLRGRRGRDNGFQAGINWGAWGTQPVEDTREFAEALLAAADMVEELNARWA